MPTVSQELSNALGGACSIPKAVEVCSFFCRPKRRARQPKPSLYTAVNRIERFRIMASKEKGLGLPKGFTSDFRPPLAAWSGLSSGRRYVL